MSEVSRRDFMALSGLAAGGAVWAGCTPTNNDQADTASSGKADQVVTNGNIYTIDDTAPRSQAFAVKNGRFFAPNRRIRIANILRPTLFHLKPHPT